MEKLVVVNEKNMVIEKILKTVWKEFIYGGHFQSLGAASIVFISAILLKIPITWDCLVAIYLVFYPAYLWDRFIGLEKDYLTNPERTKHLKSYTNWIPIIFAIVIFVLIGILIYFSNFWTLIFALLLVLFGCLYTVIFKKFTQKIPLFKNFYVSFFFGLITFFPIVYYGYIITSTLMIIALTFIVFIFFKAFMMQILLDLKDVETDKKEGLLTFPVIFGREKTLSILRIISILATAPILLISSFYFNIFPEWTLMLLFTIPFNFYCFKLVHQQKYFGYILGSGEFLFWSILILISKIIL